MIILAAAIILSLSNSGIIGKANKAKTDTDVSNAKDLVAMAHADWMLDEAKIMAEDSSITSFGKYAEKKLKEAGYKVSEEAGSYEVSDNGDVYVYPVIPTGFTASVYDGEKAVSDGLVIYETSSLSNVTQADAQKTYNQFVWVPVPDINKFQRTTTYNGTITTPGDGYSEPCSKISELSSANDTTGEYAEYSAMRESVEKNGGFYIARYESGKENNNIVIKKGATVCDVAWGTSMTEVGTTGAVALSRDLYKSSGSVVSTLIYGVEWDAALMFISGVDSVYAKDSSGKGYYGQSSITPTSAGSSESYKICNIYDMAGNAREWTMEADGTGGRLERGGRSVDNGMYTPASARRGEIPASVGAGFRVALYLK